MSSIDGAHRAGANYRYLHYFPSVRSGRPQQMLRPALKLQYFFKSVFRKLFDPFDCVSVYRAGIQADNRKRSIGHKEDVFL